MQAILKHASTRTLRFVNVRMIGVGCLFTPHARMCSRTKSTYHAKNLAYCINYQCTGVHAAKTLSELLQRILWVVC